MRHEPRVLRLRSLELRNDQADSSREAALQAKRHGVDAWIHPLSWSKDATHSAVLRSAMQSARADFPFALCLRLNGSSAIATPQRVSTVLTALRSPTYLTRSGRPMLFVRDSQGTGDLMGLTQPIRQAARAEGLREIIFVRVAGASELDGTSYVPGFDELLAVPDACTCNADQHVASAGSSGANIDRCVIVREPEAHSLSVASAVEALIDTAVAAGSTQTQLYVHACAGWTPELLRAHDHGVLRGMERMPSFPSVGAPYGLLFQSHNASVRPTLTIAMVAESNAEATMVCLQSALDTSSDMGTLQFVVVDNASSDETQGLIEALGDEVTSIRNEQPLSVKDAWAQAMQLAEGELVLMVSNDVVLGLGWHEPLVRALSTDPSCNAVSPAIAVGTNHMPTQPPAVNSGVCLLARGDAARSKAIGDARFVDESVVFLRIETPERAS